MTEISAKGHNGTITFDGRFVKIERTGFLARASVGKGDKKIPIASITAVQWKPATSLVNGYIAFSIGGGNETKAKFGNQTAAAGRDENAVVIVKKQAPAFEALREAIESAIAAHHSPTATAAPSGASEVAHLAELHAAGHLTDAEFSAAKARALGL